MATTCRAVDGCNDRKQQVAEAGEDVEDDVIGQDKELGHERHQNRPDQHVPEASKFSVRARQHVSMQMSDECRERRKIQHKANCIASFSVLFDASLAQKKEMLTTGFPIFHTRAISPETVS